MSIEIYTARFVRRTYNSDDLSSGILNLCDQCRIKLLEVDDLPINNHNWMKLDNVEIEYEVFRSSSN